MQGQLHCCGVVLYYNGRPISTLLKCTQIRPLIQSKVINGGYRDERDSIHYVSSIIIHYLSEGLLHYNDCLQR